MEQLPIEVLANHLFQYFTFSEWIRTLVRVCRLWQQAAISSNASKQLVVDLDADYGCIATIAKYRVDTLILSSVGYSRTLFGRILEASPKLNTLVVVGSLSHYDIGTPSTFNTPKRIFPHITTLSLHQDHLALLQLFPNVTRLRIEEYMADEDLLDLDQSKIEVFAKVKELEITQDSFGGWEGTQRQFPNLETLYVTVLDYAKNSKIIEEGKKLGIKVFCDNMHLIKTAWNSPNISYHLYAFQHRKTPLAYPVTIANAECSVEQLEQMMAKTSPAYEKELADRVAEFHFPARIMNIGVDPVSLGRFPAIRKPEFIKPLYVNKYLDFWTAFEAAIHANQTNLALELSKELLNHIDNTSNTNITIPILNFLEQIADTQRFLDAVGSEAVKKIMSVTDEQGYNIIARWAKSTGFNINWKPIDEYVDWNTKVKPGPEREPKIENLATVAFTEQQFDKWKYLVNDKKLDIEFDLLTDADLRSFIRRDLPEEISILATNKEKLRRIIFIATDVYRNQDLDSFKSLIAKFGNEQLSECYNGEYLLQHLVLSSYHNDELLTYLVEEQKLDINYIDKSGKTPLTNFLTLGLQESEDVSLVQTMLDLGADPNLAGDTMLPLFLALTYDLRESLKLMAALIDAGADVNAVDFDKNGRRATPLSIAVSMGASVAIIENLIAHGSDTKFVDDAGNTLLHTLLLANELEDINNLLPILVKHVDINQPNLLGETPLHRALLSGYDVTLIAKLIEYGADVNQRGGLLMIPPLVMTLNYFPTMKVLLNAKNIDIKAKNRLGESMFYTICRRDCTSDFDDIHGLLADKEFQEIAARFATPENIEFIASEVKRYINDYPQNFSNIFSLCTREMPLIKFLTETVGFDVNTKTAVGKTLLSSISINTSCSYEVAEYLIQKGADVNAQDNYGDTPLLTSVKSASMTREQYRYRHLLLKHGASVTLKNNLGLAPIDIDPMIETRYKQEEQSMAYYDDRTVADLLTPSLAELRKKRQNSSRSNVDANNGHTN